jgi:hypothetical protein
VRTHSHGGQTLTKITDGLVRGGARRVRSARERAAEAKRLVSMSRPSFGGVGALRGGDHEHQHGQHGHEYLRQEGKGRSQLPSEGFYYRKSILGKLLQ